MKNCRTFQCALLLWSLMLWIMPGMIYGVTATGGTISTNEVDDVLHVFHVFTDIGDNFLRLLMVVKSRCSLSPAAEVEAAAQVVEPRALAVALAALS